MKKYKTQKSKLNKLNLESSSQEIESNREKIQNDLSVVDYNNLNSKSSILVSPIIISNVWERMTPILPDDEEPITEYYYNKQYIFERFDYTKLGNVIIHPIVRTGDGAWEDNLTLESFYFNYYFEVEDITLNSMIKKITFQSCIYFQNYDIVSNYDAKIFIAVMPPYQF